MLLRVDEAEAALVRQVFAWYAEEGMTLYRLLGKLNASSWKPRSGRPEWPATTVLRLLRCEWYVGRAYYNRTRSTLNVRPSAELASRRAPTWRVTQRPKANGLKCPCP